MRDLWDDLEWTRWLFAYFLALAIIGALGYL
jgi:hypothetical protein